MYWHSFNQNLVYRWAADSCTKLTGEILADVQSIQHLVYRGQHFRIQNWLGLFYPTFRVQMGSGFQFKIYWDRFS